MTTLRVLKLAAISVLALFSVIVFGDPPITPNEKAAIKKFLPMVQDLLTDDYMKADTWLLRWLRAKKLDLQAAKDLLSRSIEWRKANKIDQATFETLKANPLYKQFPITFPGVDKEGRPYFISSWSGDLRKLFLSGRGKRKEFVAYQSLAFELIERKTRELNIHNNNTEWIAIYDVDGFTAATHLCVACLPAFLEHATNYELNYPFGFKRTIVPNAPRIFETILRLIDPVLGETSKRIFTYTPGSQWKEELLKIINEDQLPVKYGGTKKM